MTSKTAGADKSLTAEQEEVIKYLFSKFKFKGDGNLPEIGADTLIGLINDKLDKE